jgi:hypothetical protein
MCAGRVVTMLGVLAACGPPAGAGTDRPRATKVWVRVVDGPNTGANGYLDRAALRDELP